VRVLVLIVAGGLGWWGEYQYSRNSMQNIHDKEVCIAKEVQE